MSFGTCVMQQAGGGCTMQHNMTRSAESAQAEQFNRQGQHGMSAGHRIWRGCSRLRNACPAKNLARPRYSDSHCCILPA